MNFIRFFILYPLILIEFIENSFGNACPITEITPEAPAKTTGSQIIISRNN